MNASRILRLLLVVGIVALPAWGGLPGEGPISVRADSPGAVPAAAATSGVLSIPGISFVSGYQGNSYDHTAWGGVTNMVAGPFTAPVMHASVELPDGVTITSLTLFYSDSDATPGNDVVLDLQRDDGQGSIGGMATIDSNANDGTNRKTVTAIAEPVIDAGSYNYLLTAALNSPLVTFLGVRLTFTPNYSISPVEATAPVREAPALSLSDPFRRGALAAGEIPARYTGGTLTRLEDAPGVLGQPGAGGVQATALPGASWRRYSVPASVFHPLYAPMGHAYAPGGGRYVFISPDMLVAPLNLIHGKTLLQARFTYYDMSVPVDPLVFIVRSDRQGSGIFLWEAQPAANGGYFAVTSPMLNEVVNNQVYAYYAAVRLDAGAGSDLAALEIQVAYQLEAYLPAVLKAATR